MYFVEEELICPRCKQIFDDPRITPCSETICINCIEQLKTNDNEIDCFFCGDKHKIPQEDGFKPNTHLSKILSKQPLKIYQGKNFEELKVSLETLAKVTDQLESNMKISSLTVNEYCSNIRNQIDICAEEKINDINTIRDEYIAKLNEYEKECVQNLDAKLDIFKKNITHAREFIKKCKDSVRNNNIDDQSVKQNNSQAQGYNQSMQKKIASLHDVIFNRVTLSFQPKIEPIEMKQYFGDLVKTPCVDYCEYSNFDGELLVILEGHSGGVNALESLDDTHIASGSDDKSIKIWNICSLECVKTIQNAHDKTVVCLKSLKENILASGSGDNVIKIWNWQSGDLIKSLYGHTSIVKSMILLKNDYLASSSSDQTIIIWDLESCQAVNTLKGHEESVTCMALLNDGNIASGSFDRWIIIWNIDSGQIKINLIEHRDFVWSLILLADGNLASCSSDETINIWNIESGKVSKTLFGHTNEILCLAEMKNGNISSGSRDRTIRIWDSSSGKTLKTIQAHDDNIVSLLVLNNGYLVSASKDKTIKIWR